MLPWTPRRTEFTRERDILASVAQLVPQVDSVEAIAVNSSETSTGQIRDTASFERNTDIDLSDVRGFSIFRSIHTY